MMNYQKWLLKNTTSLLGKTVAVTGTTGGIGKALCRHLASLGASLVLVDRSKERSAAFASELFAEYGREVLTVTVDLSDISSVKDGAEILAQMPIDVFIHNAGAYSIPRKILNTGYDNVYQINFISPYYLIKKLLPTLKNRDGRVVIVGSIAHNYSKTDMTDVDFSTRKAASKVYGNAKRYLMYATAALCEREGVKCAVTHPGISFTGITAHYPRLIYAIIKYPMKIIFMKPKKASLSVVKGVFCNTGAGEWIGPRVFDIWGKPSKKPLRTAKGDEIARISDTAERIFCEAEKLLVSLV